MICIKCNQLVIEKSFYIVCDNCKMINLKLGLIQKSTFDINLSKIKIYGNRELTNNEKLLIEAIEDYERNKN